ncbi:Permeases of the major facilitator superfamily [Nitrospirillum viridazoti Y2]|uniref:Cyanate permease n=1 Tax=Nitrospirillum amazonense TaxID=28077 RepID=A0A560HK05_9PROT|nr:MFS transporter [Nitrospirillum amazonense]EGY02657.1 Permeases of the major facilitator superfamily [Nitrospirillum amazonense Y2]TWB46826.1 cyanate permease [Nitrospirillum amazonense]
MRDRNWGILIVYGVLMSTAMSLPIFGGSVVNTAMAKGLHWSSADLGMLIVVNMVVTAVLMPVAAKMTESIGIKKTMIFGFAVMIAASLGLLNLVATPTGGLIAFGMMMGVTTAFSGVIPCQTSVAAWFPNRRTLALSLLYAVVGLLAFALIALISRGIEQTGDWHFGWWVFLAAGALDIILTAVFVRDPPRRHEVDKPMFPGELELDDGSSVVYPGKTFKQALSMPLFWIITLVMVATTAGSIFLAAHAQVHLQSKGFSPFQSASSMSVMQIGLVGGNLGFGFLAPRISLRRAVALGLCIFALSFVILANASSQESLFAFAIAAGIGFGAGQVGAMAVISHYWDHDIFPMLTAIALLIQTAGSAVIPIAAGVYYDTHGSYLLPIYVMGLLNLVVAFSFYFAGYERRQSTASQGVGAR